MGNYSGEKYLVMDGPDFRRAVLDGEGSIRQDVFDLVWPRLRVLARCSPADKYTIVQGALRGLPPYILLKSAACAASARRAAAILAKCWQGAQHESPHSAECCSSELCIRTQSWRPSACSNQQHHTRAPASANTVCVCLTMGIPAACRPAKQLGGGSGRHRRRHQRCPRTAPC